MRLDGIADFHPGDCPECGPIFRVGVVKIQAFVVSRPLEHQCQVLCRAGRSNRDKDVVPTAWLGSRHAGPVPHSDGGVCQAGWALNDSWTRPALLVGITCIHEQGEEGGGGGLVDPDLSGSRGWSRQHQPE